VFRGGGQGTRFNGVDFSGTASILGSWTTDPTPVLDITVPDNGHYYWRAVVYDKFDGLSWSWSKPAASDVGANTTLLDGTGDDPSTLKARRIVRFGVTELAFDPQSVFSPDTPIGVDVPTKLTTVSDAETKPSFLAGVTADASRYTVTARVPIVYSTDHPEGVSENELAELVRWTHGRDMDLTIIEVMPLGDVGEGRLDQYLPLSLVRARLAEQFTLDEIDYRTGGPARFVRVAETGGRLGFITPLTHNFCESCNRVRLTCTGTLYMCLGQEDAADLRTPLRASERNDLIDAAIESAIARKPKGHDFIIDRRHQRPALARHMSVTGG
jgi:hypothetical protein